jgi:hypothetical protein
MRPAYGANVAAAHSFHSRGDGVDRMGGEKKKPPRQGAMAIRRFAASVTYRWKDGTVHEEEIPTWAEDYGAAHRLLLAYVLYVLKLRDFELRLVGA